MKKIVVSIVGLSMVMMMSGVAQAATVEELEVQITDLLAQIEALQTQLAGLTGAPAAAACTFTRNLYPGMSGADVKCLQQYLNGAGYPVAASGVGSAGNETEYYGSLTQAAVGAWQDANGVAYGAYKGYFGPVSQAKFTAVAPAEEEEEEAAEFFKGDDEGNLAGFDQIASLADEEVGEGEDDVPVLGFEIEAEGADQMIQRVNVVIDTPSAAAEDDLEDFITEVSLMLEGDVISTMDVDEASYDRGDDEYTFRFIGLKDIIEEDATADLEVGVSAVNNVHGDIEGQGWTVEITSIRAASPNGTDEVYDDTAGTAEAFTLETFASSANVELRASRGSDTPELQVVVGEDDDEFEADFLVFELEARNSDMTIFSLEFDIVSAPGTVDTDHMAQELMLSCEGDDWTEAVPDAGAQADDIVFDNLEIEIDEGDSIECVVSGTMNEIDGDFEEGASFTVDLDVSETDAEDEAGEGLGAGDLSGSANGYEQTFVSEGLIASDFSTDTSYTFVADEALEVSIGKYVVEFDASAVDTDVFLVKATEDVDGFDGGAGDGAGDDNEGIVYTVETNDATATTPDDVSATFECISGCGAVGDNTATEFYIADGDTETYRLTVNVTGETGDSANWRVWVDSINWGDLTTEGDEFYTSRLGEDSDSDTGYLLLIAL